MINERRGDIGLGALSIDVHRQEREYRNFTLSDENVVKLLIQYRNKYDQSMSANMNANIDEAGDIFNFNQELIAIYASLDRLIEKCKFKEKQLKLLELLFEGNTIHDVCTMNVGFKKSATYDLYNRMIAKMIRINNEDWKDSLKAKG